MVLRGSFVVKMRVKEDGPQGLPVCPGCREKIREVTLAVPSLFLRVWAWLIGKGMMPKAFVVFAPCKHSTAAERTVTMTTMVANDLLHGGISDSMELVEALRG